MNVRNYFFQKRGVALSRDSQNFRVPLTSQERLKSMNVEVVNKTANIKCKKLPVYNTV